MIAHQGGHQHLLLLVEARQVAVLQNVGRVAMHTAMVDIQPYLMEHHRPLQQRRKVRIGQLGVLFLPLFQHMGGGFQHPACLFAIDIVLIRQTLRCAATNILVAEAAFHFVQHALTQGAIGQTKFFNG